MGLVVIPRFATTAASRSARRCATVSWFIIAPALTAPIAGSSCNRESDLADQDLVLAMLDAIAVGPVPDTDRTGGIDYGSYIMVNGSNSEYGVMKIYIPYDRSTRCPVSRDFLAGNQDDAEMPFSLRDSTGLPGPAHEYRCDSYLHSTMTRYGDAATGAYWIGEVSGRVFQPTTGLSYDFKLEFSLPHT